LTVDKATRGKMVPMKVKNEKGCLQNNMIAPLTFIAPQLLQIAYENNGA